MYILQFEKHRKSKGVGEDGMTVTISKLLTLLI